MFVSSPAGHCRNSTRSGFTLPEVLIGVLMLGIVVVALYTAFTYGNFMTQLAREDMRATQILLEKGEALRLCGWQQLSNVPPTFVATYEPGVTNTSLVYTGSISIINPAVSAGYGNNLREARVLVRWSSGMLGRQRELRTYVARYGLQTYVD